MYTEAKDEILEYFPRAIKALLGRLDTKIWDKVNEIRVRADRSIMLVLGAEDWFLSNFGALTNKIQDAYIPSGEDVSKLFMAFSENSIYAFQKEIQNGFITIKGGHRVGISGRVVMQNSEIRSICDVSGINIRIAREMLGSADVVLPYVVGGIGEVYNTLIISPPKCGKTTILRDLARSVSDGRKEFGLKPSKVGIVDERSEIAACLRGIPQNNVGIRTDVYDGCPKQLGLELLLRSMSPQVIITDEIGNQGDKQAILGVINAGVKVIATAHGYDISDLKSKIEVLELIEAGVFERIIVLSSSEGPGTLEEVYDGKSSEIIFDRRKWA